MDTIPIAGLNNWLFCRTKMARRGKLPAVVLAESSEPIATLTPIPFGQLVNKDVTTLQWRDVAYKEKANHGQTLLNALKKHKRVVVTYHRIPKLQIKLIQSQQAAA